MSNFDTRASSKENEEKDAEFENQALWLPKHGSKFELKPAPYTQPAADEIVIRTHAVGLNIVDGIPRIAYRLIMPWLTFPAIVGGDIAGEVIQIGANVTRYKVGDRIFGLGLGLEKTHNRPDEGAFQHYVVMRADMTAPIPADMTYAECAVFPIQLSTAATGLFNPDQLRLELPTAHPTDKKETVLIWGGSTGVGSNAIQLARYAGYRVVTTSSPHNFDYLKKLGATAVVDRNSKKAVNDLIKVIGDGPLAGSLAIGNGSLKPVIQVAERTKGTKRVASAAPALLTRLMSLNRPKGVTVSGIWGGALAGTFVGKAIYEDFIPTALSSGIYQSAPKAVVVGHGLSAIPSGLEQLKKGVSAKKLIITL